MIEKMKIKKFRKLENIEINLGEKLTAIAGQNGTLKTTILASLVQPFGVGRGLKKEEKITREEIEDCLIVSNNFSTKINEIFKLSDVYDKPGEHDYEVYFTENLNNSGLIKENPMPVKSFERKDSTKSSRLRIVAGSKREKGYGNVEIPVIYLGLSRLFPIGEGQSTEKKIELTPKEIEYFKKNYNDILLLVDEKYTNTTIINKANEKVATTAINTETYDWKSISAGQDNIGRIISSILEFKRLKKKLGDRYTGGIILIDELEATLYPAAQVELLKFLNKESRNLHLQIAFTTHSLEILKEMLEEDNFKYHSKINFMSEQNGKLIRKEIDNYEDMYLNLMVKTKTEVKKSTVPKINIYLEDAEAKDLLKPVLPRELIKYVNIVPLKLGAPEIASIAVKINELKNGIIIFDGDCKVGKENKMINRQLKSHSNYDFLPGKESPERELIKLLKRLDKSDKFWESTKNKYIKQNFIKSITGINIDNREHTKQWYIDNKKHFGNEANILIKRWYNEPEIKKEKDILTDKIEIMIKKCYNENYGIKI